MVCFEIKLNIHLTSKSMWYDKKMGSSVATNILSLTSDQHPFIQWWSFLQSACSDSNSMPLRGKWSAEFSSNYVRLLFAFKTKFALSYEEFCSNFENWKQILRYSKQILRNIQKRNGLSSFQVAHNIQNVSRNRSPSRLVFGEWWRYLWWEISYVKRRYAVV